MSRRDLSQPSFVDAMVSGYGRVGGFLDRIEKAFDWSSFEALLSPIHGSATGAPGYPPRPSPSCLVDFRATQCRAKVWVALINGRPPLRP